MSSEELQIDLDDEFMSGLRRTFIEEATELLEACEESLMALDSPEKRPEALADIFRAYHSVKGSAAAIGCEDLAHFAHAAEDCLSIYRQHPDKICRDAVSTLLQANDIIRSRISTIPDFPLHDPEWNTDKIAAQLSQLTRKTESNHSSEKTDQAITSDPFDDNLAGLDIGSPAEDSQQTLPPPPLGEANLSSQRSSTTKSRSPSLAIKIDAARVDSVMDMVGELVVIKSQITAGLGSIQLNPRLRTLIAQLDKSVRELHERTLSMRMISLRPTFLKLQRTVKDVADKLGKAVEFEIHGEDTEIDRAMVERIADPLVHLCRNAVDHGIELPDRRQKTDKPAVGKISLRALRKGETVLIEIQDDGRGIDKQMIINKAIERKLLPENTEASRITNREAYEVMFSPGFSTAEKVTDISGRGVGLDVVKANITAINGTIETESTLGKGSTFRLCLPLTTAITDGIVATVSDKTFILPLDAVLGFFEMQSTSILSIDENIRLAKIKNNHYPFIRLGDFVGIEQKNSSGLIVLIEAMGKQLALQVDGVLGKTQVVLKPIGSSVGSTEGLGGAAIMGDGRVALIIDVAGLAAIAEKARDKMHSGSLESAASQKRALQDNLLTMTAHK